MSQELPVLEFWLAEEGFGQEPPEGLLWLPGQPVCPALEPAFLVWRLPARLACRPRWVCRWGRVLGWVWELAERP